MRAIIHGMAHAIDMIQGRVYMLMTVVYQSLEGKAITIYNVDAIKNDGNVWLLYNAFTGVPIKVDAKINIQVFTQEN
jgi:hypothetical protein